MTTAAGACVPAALPFHLDVGHFLVVLYQAAVIRVPQAVDPRLLLERWEAEDAAMSAEEAYRNSTK